MRRDKQFTLEQLKSSRDITPEDCQNLFDYAKLLYELEKYPCKLFRRNIFSGGKVLILLKGNSRVRVL
jgi:hypothetical protein